MDKIKRAMPFIITGAIMITMLVIEFTQRKDAEIDLYGVLMKAVITSAMIVSMAITWLISGNNRAKEETNSVYRANAAAYGVLIKDVEDRKRCGKMAEYCTARTKQLLAAKIMAALASVCIDKTTYDDKLVNLSEVELLKQGYNKKQFKVIAKIRQGKIKVREICPLELMTNTEVKNDNDIHHNEKMERSVCVAFRVAKSVITSTVLSLIAIELSTQITSIEAWAMFLMKACTMLYTAWSSENEGYNQIALTKNQVILRRMKFLNLFNEWDSEKSSVLSKTEQ